MSATERLTPAQIAFEIRFVLGQAPPSLYIGAHAKSPEVRLKAIEQLTALIAARFVDLTVEQPIREGRDSPLFGNKG